MRSYDGNRRMLRFGEECATETKVVCKGPLQTGEALCEGLCGDCPCEFDASGQLSAPYMRTMFEQLAQWCGSSPASADVRALMIGLGGGELPQYLLRRCPAMSVDIVELDADVIAVARRYFGLGDSEARFGRRLAVQQADSLAAVEQRAANASSAYDAVLIDCFAGGGEVPESCRSRPLLELLRGLLKPGGVLLQNIWHYSPERPQVAEQFGETLATYQSIFPGAVEDLAVPMPPHIAWVDVLRAAAAGPSLT